MKNILRSVIITLAFSLFFVENAMCLDKLSKQLSKQTSIQLSSNLKLLKNIEIEFQIMPYYSDYHIFRIAYSMDWLFEGYGVDNQFTSGFAFGTGTEISIYEVKVDLLISYLYQTGFDNRIQPANFRYETFYFSVNPKFELDNFFISINGRYYLNKLKLDDDFDSFSVNVGVGLFL